MSESNSSSYDYDDDERHDDRPRSGKKPFQVTAKRGLAYSQEDALESSSYDEDSEPLRESQLVLRFKLPPKRLKTLYTVTMETYSQSIEIELYVPLFDNVVDFVKESEFGVLFFGTLIGQRLTSKEFLGLRQLCKGFLKLLEKIFKSRATYAGHFNFFYKPPWSSKYSPKSFFLWSYTYRSIYARILNTYSSVGQTAFEIKGRRKIPLPIVSPMPKTMQAFGTFDVVIEAISRVFASNTATQRKELKKLLDAPIAAIRAHELLGDIMDTYPDIDYKTNFHKINACFTVHLEVKLYILLKCPTLLDFPNYNEDTVDSPSVVKAIVRELHDTLNGLRIAASNQSYIADLMEYLTRDSMIRTLLVVTACFRGGSLSDWESVDVTFRSVILTAINAKAVLKILTTQCDDDNWEGMDDGGVIIRSCQELLQIKFPKSIASSPALDVINKL